MGGMLANSDQVIGSISTRGVEFHGAATQWDHRPVKCDVLVRQSLRRYRSIEVSDL